MAMRMKGLTYAQIAEELKISKAHAYRLVSRSVDAHTNASASTVAMARHPRLAQLVSVAEVARIADRPKRTMARHLARLWERDEERGGADWRYRMAEDGKILINLERLRARHPALFERRYVARGEFESLIKRVEGVELSQHRARNEVRELRKVCEEAKSRATSGHSGPHRAA